MQAAEKVASSSISPDAQQFAIIIRYKIFVLLEVEVRGLADLFCVYLFWLEQQSSSMGGSYGSIKRMPMP